MMSRLWPGVEEPSLLRRNMQMPEGLSDQEDGEMHSVLGALV